MFDLIDLYLDALGNGLTAAWSTTTIQVMAKVAAVGFVAALILGACGDVEDPDPCDPTCPPTTENPSGN